MERKIYDKFLSWKKASCGSTALFVEGARRIGKSFIVEEFAKKEYKSYIIIDFNRASKEVWELFDSRLNDLDGLFFMLSELYGVKLYRRQSVIIFDEVQLCPRARAAIKYLVADGRYDFIETGSLVSIRKNVQDILIPSEEERIKMYPMDFEEFLWAMGSRDTVEFLRVCFEQRRPLGQALHRKVMDMFRKYMIIGGMPQAVAEFVRSGDLSKVDKIKRNILDLYRSDMAKYSEGYGLKVVSIFDEMPAQLGKQEKKFKLSALKKEARFRDYEDAFFWLGDAMITNQCYNTTEPSIGLRLNMDRTTLKCYMGDTGLLLSHAFSEDAIESEGLYKKILFDKLEFNNGMITENIVAQMLACNGHKLFFYSNPSNEDAASKMEIDFLISKGKVTSRHNISPIEVKSGKNYTLTSLRKFINKYSEQLHIPYVIHTADLKEQDGIVYLPIYMTMFL